MPPILHAMLKDQGTVISLSSVGRILKREGLLRKKKQLKPPYAKIRRPKASCPGALVEMDTIHYVRGDGSRFYLYVMIDIYTRLGYVYYSPSLSAYLSYQVYLLGEKVLGVPIQVLQTDNGSEFSEQLYLKLKRHNTKLRHTRVRRPNDNAHVERFNRTIKEECFKGLFPKEEGIQEKLDNWIEYYNKKRYHLGINCKPPIYMLQSY